MKKMNKYTILLLVILFFSCGGTDTQFIPPLMVETEGLSFPEGPVFAGDELLFSNCYGMWIGRLYENGRLDTFADLSALDLKPNGLYWSDKHELWVCEYNQGRILKLNNRGEILKILDNNGQRFSRPNDITFYQGLIYFTDPKSYSKDVRDGKIYILDPVKEEIRLFAANLAFPNGLAVSPDGKKLIVCESADNRVVSLSMDNPEIREVIVTLPGADPDGIEFNSQGILFIAHFGGGKVYTADIEKKTLLDSLDLPGKRVTNLVFNHDESKLYITEAELNKIYSIRLNH